MNSDADEPSLQDQFFSAMGHVAEPVWVVTTYDHNDDPTGFTATSVTSLSGSPPSLIGCINKGNEGTPAYAEGKPVAAHVLSSGQDEVGNRFAGMGGEIGLEKFEGGVQWHREGKLPVLEDVSVTMTGVIDLIYDGYTHNITVVKVDEVRQFERSPLLYWNGKYLDLDA